MEVSASNSHVMCRAVRSSGKIMTGACAVPCGSERPLRQDFSSWPNKVGKGLSLFSCYWTGKQMAQICGDWLGSPAWTVTVPSLQLRIHLWSFCWGIGWLGLEYWLWCPEPKPPWPEPSPTNLTSPIGRAQQLNDLEKTGEQQETPKHECLRSGSSPRRVQWDPGKAHESVWWHPLLLYLLSLLSPFSFFIFSVFVEGGRDQCRVYFSISPHLIFLRQYFIEPD